MEVTCIKGSKSVLSRQSPSSVPFLLKEQDFASNYSVRNKFLLAHTSQANSGCFTETISSECVARAHVSKPTHLSEVPVSICRIHAFAHAPFCTTVTDVVIWFVIRFPPFLCEI